MPIIRVMTSGGGGGKGGAAANASTNQALYRAKKTVIRRRLSTTAAPGPLLSRGLLDSQDASSGEEDAKRDADELQRILDDGYDEGSLAVEDINEFYERSAEKIGWETGMGEVRRLVCALRFLVEEKRIEQELLDANGYENAYDGDLVSNTIASGAQSVQEFRRAREVLAKKNETRRQIDDAEAERQAGIEEARLKHGDDSGSDVEEDLLARQDSAASVGASGGAAEEKHAADDGAAEQHNSKKEVEVPGTDNPAMFTDYKIVRRGPGAIGADSTVSSRQDFETFVEREVREREAASYRRRWAEWEAMSAASRDIRAADPSIVNADAFDPDPQLTEFERVSYEELVKFVFTRAVPETDEDRKTAKMAEIREGQGDGRRGSLGGGGGDSDDDDSDDDDGGGGGGKRGRHRRRRSSRRGGKNKKTRLEKIAALRARLNQFFVQKVRKYLLRLHRMEYNPRYLRDEGHEFLFKVDNYLAVLLYRRGHPDGARPARSFLEQRRAKAAKAVRKKEMRQMGVRLETKSKSDPSRLIYWQALVHKYLGDEPAPEKIAFAQTGVPEEHAAKAFLKPKSLQDKLASLRDESEDQGFWRRLKWFFFGFCLTALVAFSVWGLYSIWVFTSTRALQGVADSLSAEIETAVDRVVSARAALGVSAQRLVALGLQSGALALAGASLNETDNEAEPLTAEMDRFLAAAVADGGVSAVHVATADGRLAGAVSAASAAAGVVSVRARLVLDSATGDACVYEYPLDAATGERVWADRVLLTCDDPRALDSYGRLPGGGAPVADAPGSSARAAERAAQDDAEGFTGSAGDLLGGRERGVAFSGPVYSATPAASGGGGFDLAPEAAVVSELSGGLLGGALSSVAVGLTGVTYVADAPSAGELDIVFSGDPGNGLEALTVTYLLREMAALDDYTELFVDDRAARNCTDDGGTTDANEGFSQRELDEVQRAPIKDIDGEGVIVTARDLSDTLSDTPANLQLPDTWVTVVAFPERDYFSAVRESENLTLALGLVAVFFGFVLLYFTHAMIPDVAVLRAQVMEQIEQEELEAAQRKLATGSATTQIELTRAGRSRARLQNAGKAFADDDERVAETLRRIRQENEDKDRPTAVRRLRSKLQAQSGAGEDSSEASSMDSDDGDDNGGGVGSRGRALRRGGASSSTAHGLHRHKKPHKKKKKKKQKSKAKEMAEAAAAEQADAEAAEAEREEDMSRAFADRWEKRTTRYGVGFFTVMVVLAFSSIAFVWSTNSAESVDAVADDLITETYVLLDRTASDFLARVSDTAGEVAAEAERTNGSALAASFAAANPGAYVPGSDDGARLFFPPSELPPTPAAGRFAYDEYFYETMRAFRLPDGNFTVTSLYAGFANGDFAGAEVAASSVASDDSAVFGDGELLVAARDNHTGDCFQKFRATADGVRNESALVFESDGCAFDPRERLWYETARADFELSGGATANSWTPIYLFSGRAEIGLTLVRPIVAGDGSLAGVAAADANLAYLSQRLQSLQLGSSCFSRFFVLERSGKLVASSVVEVTRTFGSDDTGTEVVFLLDGVDASDEDVAGTSLFLTQRAGGLGAVDGGAVVERPLESPITGVDSVEADQRAESLGGNASAGIDWVVVAALPFDVFLGEFDDFGTLSFLLSIATVVIILLLVSLSLRSFQAKLVDRGAASEPDADERAKLLGRPKRLPGESEAHWEERTLVLLMRDISSVIRQSCAYTWNRQSRAEREEWAPLPVADVREFSARQAVRHVQHGRKGRDILTIASLEERAGNLPRRGYKLYTSFAYTKFIMAVIVVHVGVALFEPDTLDDMRAEGTDSRLLLLELCCLGVEMFDATLNFLIKIRWRDQRKEEEEIREMRERARAAGKNENSWRIRIRERFGVNMNKALAYDFVYTFVVAMILSDWWSKYTDDFSQQYYFPWRPFLLILRGHSIRNTTENFVRTVSTARDIFLLYGVVTLTASALGLVLFRSTLRELSANGPEASYSNFVRAMITTFVFISTGDNYTDIVYDAFDVSPLYMFYFIAAIVFGMFFILALVIGWFQVGFVRMSEERAQKAKLERRTAVVAAFILLDMDSSERLAWNEVNNFLRALAPVMGKDDDQLQAAKKRLRDTYERNLRTARGLPEDAPGEEGLPAAAAGSAHGTRAVSGARTPRSGALTRQGSTARSSAAITRQGSAATTGGRAVMRRQDSNASAGGGGGGSTQDADARSEGAATSGAGEFDEQAEAEVLEEAGINVRQFVIAVEAIKWERKDFSKDVTLIPKWRQLLQLRFFQQEWYSMLLAVLVMAHLVLVSLLGTVDSEDERYVDWTAMGIFWFHVADITLRLVAYGWREYWWYSKYHKGLEAKYDGLTHRYDLFLVAVSLIGFQTAWSWSDGRVTFSDPDAKLRYEIVTSLMLLRIFTVIRRVRRLFFTLVQILPRFGDLFAILAVIFIVYGVVGVNLFAGKFDELLQQDAPASNFDSLSDALQSLFQMLVGEGWSELMYAGIQVRREFTAAWYFVTFVCLASLLFVNIFVGLILQAFNVFHREGEEQKKREAAEWKRRMDELTDTTNLAGKPQ